MSEEKRKTVNKIFVHVSDMMGMLAIAIGIIGFGLFIITIIPYAISLIKYISILEDLAIWSSDRMIMYTGVSVILFFLGICIKNFANTKTNNSKTTDDITDTKVVIFWIMLILIILLVEKMLKILEDNDVFLKIIRFIDDCLY